MRNDSLVPLYGGSQQERVLCTPLLIEEKESMCEPHIALPRIARRRQGTTRRAQRRSG